MGITTRNVFVDLRTNEVKLHGITTKDVKVGIKPKEMGKVKPRKTKKVATSDIAGAEAIKEKERRDAIMKEREASRKVKKKPVKKVTAKKAKSRTPEEQLVIDKRMAKMRAARKKK